MLILSVKDRDLFGISNQYVAECYITFAEIKRSDGVQQIHLTLNRPNTSGLFTFPIPIASLNSTSFPDLYFSIVSECDCVRALELRQGDKLARDFIRKQQLDVIRKFSCSIRDNFFRRS